MAALEGRAWTLPPAAGASAERAPTLSLAGGRASGSDGCNRYTSSFTTAPGKLQFGQMAGTQMACIDEDTAQLARVFNEALAHTRSYRLQGADLVLLDAGGAELLTLAPQAAGLAGTAWQATAVNNGRQAVAGVLAGTTLSLQFVDGQRVAGSAGCNTFSGAYRYDDKGLAIGPLAATRKACAQPAGVMEQEPAFLRALESAATARREADTLQLRTATGATAVNLRQAQP